MQRDRRPKLGSRRLAAPPSPAPPTAAFDGDGPSASKFAPSSFLLAVPLRVRVTQSESDSAESESSFLSC